MAAGRRGQSGDMTRRSDLHRLRRDPAPSHSHAIMAGFLLRPDPDDPRLTRRVPGIDQDGAPIETAVVVERPLTLFLNGQEIVTMMTIGDYPAYLGVGYLLNQNMLRPDDRIEAIEHDDELGVVVVRTARKTDYEKKLRKKTLTPSCAPAGSTACRGRSTPRPASISPPAPSMAACYARAIGRWSMSRTSGATTRSTRSPATCTSRASGPRARSSTPPAG